MFTQRVSRLVAGTSTRTSFIPSPSHNPHHITNPINQQQRFEQPQQQSPPLFSSSLTTLPQPVYQIIIPMLNNTVQRSHNPLLQRYVAANNPTRPSFIKSLPQPSTAAIPTINSAPTLQFTKARMQQAHVPRKPPTPTREPTKIVMPSSDLHRIFNQTPPTTTTTKRYFYSTPHSNPLPHYTSQPTHSSPHPTTHRYSRNSRNSTQLPRTNNHYSPYHPIHSQSLVSPLILLETAKRFARLDFSRYYFFARNRKMRYLLTKRGLIRPGRKHNYKSWIFKQWQLGFWRYAVSRIWGRRIKWFFYLLFWYYLILYLMPFFLRWQYDLNPRTLTRFSKLDFQERWEHKIMSDLRMYRHLHKYQTQPGTNDPNVALFGLTTPAGKPYRQGLIYYYFMLVIFPFTSGMLDPLLYPRLFFFGLYPYIPPEYDDPRVPQNVLITMSTRDLLKFLSICQTRMYLATQSDLYVDQTINSQYVVYDTHNELEEYKLRCKRYRFNLDVLNKTYAMVIHEIFRRIHSAVFYSGRHSVIPSPKYVPSIPKYELSSDELSQLPFLFQTDSPNDLASALLTPQQRLVVNIDDDDIIYNDDTFKTEIPGLYQKFKQDQYFYGGIHSASTFTRLRYLFHEGNRPSGEFTLSPFTMTKNLYGVLSNSFLGREGWLIARELMNFVHVSFDRLTWTGAKTGFEKIKGLDITTTGRDAAVLDYRLHDFQRPNYPLFFTTIQRKLYQFNQVMYALFGQFQAEHRLDRDILEKFQYPIMNLNSDIDEIVHYLTQPEVNSHYSRMLQALAEIDHSNNDGIDYDYRRVNLGLMNDRRFKLKQNTLILQNIINVIQQDLDIAKATTIRDVANDITATGTGDMDRSKFDFRNDGYAVEDPRPNRSMPLSSKQFGCEWVLYDLKLQHREMRRISRDLEYFLQSDQASAIDENVEPCRGDTNFLAKTCDLVPFRLGNIPKNVLRRVGWIERGSIPLHVLNTQRKLPARYQTHTWTNTILNMCPDPMKNFIKDTFSI